ncbi:hypothetical protein I7X12_08560 [Halosimplex litoreum]|uniref:Uncharacterized protein n=1 Tax=Halosimplex litoreum TaxID=1198301 RepID=A0A7U3WAJ8_9EURY|nr:hypothetical protein [Halosimplex litoreum]QPV64643.1 hypothetical protein I7X12_08560 [Halosimplex litoreum]
MRDVSLSLADRAAAFGVAVLAVGVYLHWGQDLVGTLGARPPWDLNGFYPGRALVLVPPLSYGLVRASRSLPRIEVGVLCVAAFLCVAYPPVRLLEAPGGYTPYYGFFLTTLSGLAFAVAATARYAEAFGIDSPPSGRAAAVDGQP